MNGGLEARPRALERLEREGAREVGDGREALRAHEPERRHRCHELRPVDEREAFLARKRNGLEPDAAKGIGSGEALPCDDRLALADEREREVCERSEVAARADRATRRND